MNIPNASLRRFAVGSLLLGVVASGAACDDDENLQATAQAGSSGSGTAGTSSGKGGTAGAAGSTAGTAGSSGTAGKGGGTAGTAGKGGAGAGGAGAGGTAGKGGAGAGGAGAGGAGAGGSAGGTLCGPVTGDGTLGKQTKVADGGAEFTSPFDATPSPDGCTVYFTAVDPKTLGGAVFSVAKDGTGLKRLDTGNLLVAPVGVAVSTDGKTIFVADAGFGAADTGAIVSLSSSGGMPTATSTGNAPHSIAVAKEGTADQIYFAGTGATGESVFKVAASGGNAAAVVGVPGGLGGVAPQSAGGFLFVTATSGALSSSTGGAPTLVVGNLDVGLPGGVAVSSDGTAALVATKSGGVSGLLRVVLASKATTFTAVGSGLVEPGGVHRAHGVEVYAFADGLGANGSGSIWVAEKN